MSWRLSDATLLRPCVWSGRKHAASAVLASHHGNASGQMLCMNISDLTDLCLLVPHCRSLHGGNLVACVPPEPGALADHVMSCRQHALGGISSEAEAAAHAGEEAPPKRKTSSFRPDAVQFYFEYRDFMFGRGLTAQASFRQLQHIAPELYGDVNEHTQKMVTLWRAQALGWIM